MRVSDCVACGAGVGRLAETLCWRCRARAREAALRSTCPGCNRFLRLRPETGRCIRCSRTCVDCGGPLRFKASVRCLSCRRRHEAAAARRPCPRCNGVGYLRPETGWCGHCSRPRPAPRTPTACTVCGELRRRKGTGMCNRCWSRQPDRAVRQAEGLVLRLDNPPEWLVRFSEFAAERHCAERACHLVTQLGRLLGDAPRVPPQALLERSRQRGRSAGTLARTLEDFLVAEGLAFGLDQDARLAAGRRQRRVEGTPAPLRPAVALFADAQVRSRERARKAGTRLRADSTIETNIATVRDLARFVVLRGKSDWATVDTGDIEAFIGLLPRSRPRRLGALANFFRFAKARKLVLVDPTRGIAPGPPRPMTTETLTPSEERRLFRRWTSGDALPNESLLGLLTLLHGASLAEVRNLTVDRVHDATRSVQLGRRPYLTPLDPATWAALQRVLAARRFLGTRNPHVIVTRSTKTRSTPASTPYLTHLLDSVGIPPQRIRVSRIAKMVVGLDAKVVASAFGMNETGMVRYLADAVDRDRLETVAPPGRHRAT